MPDVDKIGKLSRRWSNVFVKFLEGYDSIESLANDSIEALRKDLQDYGSVPVNFLKEASIRLQDILRHPLFLSTHNWTDEDQFINDLKLKYMQGHKLNLRAINIAVDSYKDFLHKLRNEEVIKKDLESALIDCYVRRVYDCNFGGQAPLELKKQTNADYEKSILRLGEIKSVVDNKIYLLASQLTKKKTFKLQLRLRLPSVRRKKVSIHDDVFKLGNNL